MQPEWEEEYNFLPLKVGHTLYLTHTSMCFYVDIQ